MSRAYEDLGNIDAGNDFGDGGLTTPFVWDKKRQATEKKIKKRLSKSEHTHRETERQTQNREELSRVKKRRKEREMEIKEREDERYREQRQKETDRFKEWEKQEDDFHLKQAKLRSEIRLGSNRAKPIDKLARYVSLSASESALDVEVQEPYKILMGLGRDDLEDLLEDIKVYVSMEKGENQHFWKNITIIVEEEIRTAKNEKKSSNSRAVINAQLYPEMIAMFEGKSHSELASLFVEIERNLETQELEGRTYWESVLRQLKAHMAKLRLKEGHQDMLNRKLVSLKEESCMQQREQGHQELATEAEEPSIVTGPSSSRDIAPHEDNTNEDFCLSLYEQSSYSPTLLSPTEVPNERVFSWDQAKTELLLAQSRVMRGEMAETNLSTSESELVSRAEQDGFVDGEEFSSEIRIEHSYLWMDKYRPRKPRYFNRVHTGFEWNKYNQTHYDHDNPPPKIVQGYKFNIFYPDLIDKTKTPEYFFESCKDGKEFVILRFHAGPPYEDIAFKVVNREWEYSCKHGFRSQFNCNIFQLWFHFKRNRYRK